MIYEPYAGNDVFAYYFAGLFTTHQSIGALWLSAPNQNNDVIPMASVRTSWAAVLLDPNTHIPANQNEHFARAISGDMTLTTDAVVGTPIPSPYSPVTLTAPGLTSRGQNISVSVFRPLAR